MVVAADDLAGARTSEPASALARTRFLKAGAEVVIAVIVSKSWERVLLEASTS